MRWQGFNPKKWKDLTCEPEYFARVAMHPSVSPGDESGEKQPREAVEPRHEKAGDDRRRTEESYRERPG